MNKVTFICWPKPFSDKTEYYPLQRNALLSWKKLDITEKIVVIGNESGNKEFCKEYDIIHEPEVGETNKFGTPLLKSILKQGYKYCNVGDSVCYINSDIILLKNYNDTVCSFLKSDLSQPTYLGIGQRYDWNSPEAIDFDDLDWEINIEKKTILDGKLQSFCLIDYFLHKAHSYPVDELPTLAIGRLHWDRWLVGYGVRNFDTTVDFSNTVTAIHQETSYLLNNSKIDKDNHAKSEECITNCGIDIHYGMNINDSQYISKNVDGKIKFVVRPKHFVNSRVLIDGKWYDDSREDKSI